MSGHAIATAILLSLGAIGTAAPVAAQLRPPEPSPAVALFRPGPALPSPRPAPFIHSKAPDYRWEGLVIGALALGALGAYVGNQLCVFSDSLDKHCFREASRFGPVVLYAHGARESSPERRRLPSDRPNA